MLKFKKVAKPVAFITFVLVVLMLLAFSVLQAVSPSLSVERVGIGLFLVTNTGSMKPTLRYNDLIIVKRACFDSLEVYDIVTFRAVANINGNLTEIYITHQIINAFYSSDGTRYFKTQGTNARGADREFLTIDGRDGSNKFVGIFVAKNSIMGNLFAYLRSPFGVISLIINIGITTLILNVYKLDW